MTAVFVALAALFAVYGAVLLLRRGPLPCVHYFILPPDQRAAVRTPREYRNAGVCMLLFAAAWAAALGVQELAPGWTTKYLLVLLASLVIYLCTYDLKPRRREHLPEQDIRPGGTGGIL